MGSPSPDESSQKAIEGDLVDAGNGILAHSSSTAELLVLLEKAESLLSKVWQQPPLSTCKSLHPLLKALITDKVFRHDDDLNIQVAVASCASELTRITAPDPPYDDNLMLVFFRLFMVAFTQLPGGYGSNYLRSLQILETMARVKSSLLLMDIDTEGLIVEMFKLFLDNIIPNHPPDVIEHMEMIMSLVIEESDKISLNLLRLLLDSVKMENKKTSPTSWKLGTKVFENCATKLQPNLNKAMEAMNLDADDYAEIVASICNNAPVQQNMVSEEIAPPAVGDVAAPQSNDDSGTKLDDENPLETLKGSQRMQSGSGTGAIRRTRGKKPSSRIRPEEGYEPTWIMAKYSAEISFDVYNQEKKDLALPLGMGNTSMLSDKKTSTLNEGKRHKRSQSKKNERNIDEDDDVELSSILKRKLLQTKVEKRGQNCPKNTGKIHSVTSAQGKNEEDKKEMQKDVVDQMEEFPLSNPAKAKDASSKKKKKSRRSQVSYGENLVNLRILVWWPMDVTFYAGTVKEFDPKLKTHQILYDDGEVENLNLKVEIWKLCDGEQPPQAQEDNPPSPAKEPIKTQEKTAKRKAGSSKRQMPASSSKRSKGKKGSVTKSGKNSEAGLIHDEARNEVSEANASQNDDVAGNEELKTLVKEMESENIDEDV